MRPYYGDDTPDLDDTQGPLGEAITLNVVPPGCRLGGIFVMREHAAGRDPCISICPHTNRSGEGGCGGRAASAEGVYASIGKATHASNTMAESRKALRAQQISFLNRLADEATKKSK